MAKVLELCGGVPVGMEALLLNGSDAGRMDSPSPASHSIQAHEQRSNHVPGIVSLGPGWRGQLIMAAPGGDRSTAVSGGRIRIQASLFAGLFGFCFRIN